MAVNQSKWNLTTSSWVNSSEEMITTVMMNDSVETRNNSFGTRFGHGNTEMLDNFTFVIGSFGSVANGFVLLALLCARQSRRKNINVFIINQTVLDLLTCLFLVLTIVIGRLKAASATGKWIICLLFKTRAVVAVASYSSIFGLVVITAERYVKIVHSVVHRNNYRRWMTYAGVVLPWVDGICCYLIPAWATSAVDDSKCHVFAWPTSALLNGYVLTMFVLHYVMPPAFFFFAYYRIIGVIRRQQRVVNATSAGASSSIQTAVSSREAQEHEQRPRPKGMNVVRTMIVIVVCFCICYLPYNVYDIIFPSSSRLPLRLIETNVLISIYSNSLFRTLTTGVPYNFYDSSFCHSLLI